MEAPEGYVPLDLVGFTDKGDYVAGNTYAANDLAHNDNKIYRSLQDNNIGHDLPEIPESKTEWWELWLSGGADDLGAITVNDTSNVTGSGAGEIVVAQALIDAIANKIMNDMVMKNMIVNNLLATVEGKVLDATQGKTLDEKITQLNSNIKHIIQPITETQNATLTYNNTTYINGIVYFDFAIETKVSQPNGTEYWYVTMQNQLKSGNILLNGYLTNNLAKQLSVTIATDKSIKIINTTGSEIPSGSRIQISGCAFCNSIDGN